MSLLNLKSLIKRINPLGMVLLTLPMKNNINSFFLIILFLTGLYSLIVRLGNVQKTKIYQYFPSVFLFILICLSACFSINNEEGIKKILLYLPLIVFPIYFSGVSPKLEENSEWLKYLLAGLLLTIFYSILQLVINVIFLDERYDYGYGIDLFLQYLPHHIYLSLMIMTAIYWVLQSFLENRIHFTLLLSILPLSLVLFFVASRTAIVSYLILIPIYVYFLFKDRLGLKKSLVILTAFLILIVIGIFSFDYTKDKLIYAYKLIAHFDTTKDLFSGVIQRIEIWKTGYDLIKERPLLGYGIGDVQDVLDRAYIDKGKNDLIDLNAHNQYLQILLSFGFIFGLGFLLLLIHTIINNTQSKDKWVIFTWITVFIYFLTESILNRHWGVVIFSFLLSLTISLSENKTYRIKLFK